MTSKSGQKMSYAAGGAIVFLVGQILVLWPWILLFLLLDYLGFTKEWGR